MKYIIAHDFGTSSVKSVIFSVDGTLVHACSASYETRYSNGTWAEQDPEDWWRAFCQNNKALLAGLDASEVGCVSFGGTYPNLICLGRDLRPLCPAMIWQDNRAAAEAEEISDRMTPDYANQYRGGRMTTDRTLPKLLWLRKNRPELYEKLHKILPCVSQYILLKLTGAAVADYRTGFSTGLTNLERNAWSDYMLSLAEVPVELLPELHKRTDVVGAVPAALAEECGLAAGTRLVLGTGDGDCADVGMGMLHDGDAYLNGSTSAAFLVVNTRVKGGWPPPTSCSGASIDWMRDTLCTEEKQLAAATGRSVYDIINERIATAPVGCHGVMFHPYLSGDRGAINNPHAKGSFTGITLEATHADMLRAVYEGVGMNLCNVLQIARDAGYSFQRMPMVGGMAKSSVLRQILADILGIELYTVIHTDEAGAIGAAVLGGIGTGVYEDESAYRLFMRPAETTRPDPENHRHYAAMRALYNEVYRVQLPLYESM